MPDRFETGRTAVAAVPLRDSGGEGPPLLLLGNGAGLGWESVAPSLATRCRLLTPAVPATLAELLAAVDLPRLAILGAGTEGGALALRLARAWPGRVQRAVLVAPLPENVLAEPACPVLIVYGAGGPDGRRAEGLAATLPAGRLGTVPAPDPVHASDPHAFLRAVVPFLSGGSDA